MKSFDMAAILPLMIAALGFFAASIGIFRAAFAMAGFFRSAGQLLARIPQALEGQYKTQNEMLRAQERQAAALERAADLVPALERFHAAQEQVAAEIRTLYRQFRQLKDVITGERTDAEDQRS